MDIILYKRTEMVFTHVIYAGSLLLLRTSVYPDDSSPYREKRQITEILKFAANRRVVHDFKISVILGSILFSGGTDGAWRI